VEAAHVGSIADVGHPSDWAVRDEYGLPRLLPTERIQNEKARMRRDYATGRPYPHVVIDRLWDDGVLDRIISEFPRPGQRDWIEYDTAHEVKQTSRGLFGLSPFTQLFLLQVCSPPFLQFVSEVTGEKELVPDPLYHGGGLHESFTGGWLNLHVDWTQHPVLPLARRLNMIIYLNRDWDPAWGGDIELCDFETKTCGAMVAPLFNRTLIFPTTTTALHGFPSPIKCPAHRTRQSISLFYWNRDPEAIKTAGNINFLPGKKDTRLLATIRPFVPPILFAARRALRRKLAGKKR
jgi:hypothetical protein